MRKWFRDVPLGFIHGIRALRQLGRLAEAEELEGAERMLGDLAAGTEFGQFTLRRGHQGEAALR